MALHFLEIIREISPAERKKFEKYLFFAHEKEQKVIRVWMFIRPSIGTKKPIDEQALYRYVFLKAPDKSLKHLHNLFHDLKKILLDFLAWREMTNQGDQRESLLLRMESLRKLGTTQLYLQQLEKAQKDASKTPKHSLWKALEQWMLLHHQCYYATDNTWEKRGDQMNELIRTLDTLYAAFKWMYHAERESREKIISGWEGSKPILPVPTLELAQSAKDAASQMANLFSKLYLLALTNDPSLYQSLYLAYETQRYGPEEQLVLLMALINFKIREINNNQTEARRTVFLLYQSGVERGVFMTGGFFPIGPFHNIVTIACLLREFQWVLHFIDQTAEYLPPKERENTRQISRAKVFFEQGDFDQTMDVLNTINIQNMADSLQCRLLSIRTYYELPPYRYLVKRACMNLEQYVKNKGALSVSPVRVKRFCRIMSGLAGGNKSRAQLENWVNKYPDTLHKNWLLEKIQAVP